MDWSVPDCITGKPDVLVAPAADNTCIQQHCVKTRFRRVCTRRFRLFATCTGEIYKSKKSDLPTALNFIERTRNLQWRAFERDTTRRLPRRFLVVERKTFRVPEDAGSTNVPSSCRMPRLPLSRAVPTGAELWRTILVKTSRLAHVVTPRRLAQLMRSSFETLQAF